MTDEVLKDTIREEARPWGEQWESLKVNESEVVEGGTSTGGDLTDRSESHPWKSISEINLQGLGIHWDHLSNGA